MSPQENILNNLMFSPIGMIIVILISLSVTQIIIKMLDINDPRCLVKKILCWLLFATVSVLSYPVLMSDMSRPSRVDITLVYVLEDAELVDIYEKLLKLENEKYVNNLRVKENVIDKNEINIYYEVPGKYGSVHINIFRCSDNDLAEELFHNAVHNRGFGKCKNHQITDNIAISLYNSRMDRSIIIARASRDMQTYLLLDNYLFAFWEDAYYKDIGKLTSQALVLICEALTK